MKIFRNFDVYRNSIELAKTIYSTTSDWTTKEKYGIISQITRAAVSIPSNIADGSSRNNDAYFSRFLQYSFPFKPLAFNL